MEKFGQYILLEKVGSGGMAELFKAKKLGIEGFERVLAIKRILPHLSSDDEFIEMFIDEAKLVARLSHRNITQVYDFGKIDQNYFIAMEYVRGKDLKAIFRRCREERIKMPITLAVYIAKEVTSALSYAHSQKDSTGKNLNIIHRDVSPQNVLVSYDGEIQVVDFGIAKAGAHSRTSTGVLKGKLSYMSPEQAWGKTIDHRSDIFSLGIVLYEMLTGERLFKGDTEINTLEKVRVARVEPIPSAVNADIPKELEAIVLKTLKKELTDRYQTASEVEADLSDVLFKLSSSDPSITLKKFMHDLFKAEIEAEHESEIRDETMSIQFKQEAEEPVFVHQKTEEKKHVRNRKIYLPVIFSFLFLAVIISAYMFWPEKNENKNITSQAPVSSTITQPVTSKNKRNIPEKSMLSNYEHREQAKKIIIEDSQGGLTINATPWANVYLDDKQYGTTPKTIEALKVGRYRVRLENPNFPAWETDVNIAKGKITKVSYKFTGFGKLIVNATPWGNVYLDGTLKGQTPLTIDKIPAKRYQIKVSRDGFAEFTKSLEIKEGETEKVSVNLEKKVEE